MNIWRIVLLFFIVFCQNKVFALDVVYPKSINPRIHAKSTFFVGNIGKDKTFFINKEPVKTYKDGVFVHVVPLEFGVNNFELTSVSECGQETTLNYKIIRPEPLKDLQQSAKNNLEKPEVVEFDEYIVAQTIKNNTPLRSQASDNSARIVHLDEKTTVLLDAQKGDFYRVYTGKNSGYWIKKRNFEEISRTKVPPVSTLKHFKYSFDRRFEYFSFRTNTSLPFKLKETDCGVEVELYYVSGVPSKLEKFTQNIKFENNTLTFFVPHSSLWGYDCFFDGSNMVFKLTREVKIDTHSPLKNLVIAIDPGHGGRDSGAIGPTRVREADLALDISKKLREILQAEGVKVVMTRECDEYVDLYKRVEIIKSAKPLFSISIHANALPDGADPYVRYGTSVYYYHPQARNFAEVLKRSIVENLNMKDDGTRYASFVLTRTTSPISVLIETAYMINPSDYENLLNEDFRQKMAQSIANGIKAYMHASVPK